MFDQDERQSEKQRERLNEQLSSLFDDDFDEDEYDDLDSEKESLFHKKKKRKKRVKREKYDDELDDYEEDDKPRKSRQKPHKSLFQKKKKDDHDDFNDIDDISDLFDSNSDDDSGNEYEDYEEDIPKSKKKPQQNPSRNRPRKRKKPVYYDKDGNVLDESEYLPKRKTPAQIVLRVFVFLVVGVIGLFAWGYYNTDFDKNGNAYYVPEEIYAERAYMVKADKLLNTILTMDSSFDEDTYYLPTDYTNMYAKLNSEKENLIKETNKLAKYDNVPSDYTSYQSDLLNFSLSIQDCIPNLISNKDASDYEDYREEVMKEYLQDLNKIKKERKEIETNLFRNMNDKEGD